MAERMAPRVYGYETIEGVRSAATYFADRYGRRAWLYRLNGRFGLTAVQPDAGDLAIGAELLGFIDPAAEAA